MIYTKEMRCMAEHDDNSIEGYLASPETHDKDEARTAYLGYATLAYLSRETMEQGIGIIERANIEQAARLQSAFASAAQVLMEVKGLVEPTVATQPPVEESVQRVVIESPADSLKRPLPWVGKRYLSNLVGSVDDIELHLGHIPALVEMLIEMRGKIERVERRSLDLHQLLTLRFTGLSTEEIAEIVSSNANRVKGAFFRFGQGIEQQGTTEERGVTLRSHLAAHDLLTPKHSPTVQELDDSLPGYAPKKLETAETRRVIGKRKSALVATELHKDVDPQAYPEDLLPDESMGERRIRLRQQGVEE